MILQFKSGKRDVSISNDPAETNEPFTEIMSDDFMRSVFNSTKWYESSPKEIVNATTKFINITNVHITEDY